MVWWKVALPLAVAGSGIAAATVAIVRSDDVAAAPAAVWIDAPADLAALHSGVVVVQAHADLGTGGTLALVIDGDTVATDGQPQVVDRLAYSTFQWQADVGTHELVVVASDGGRSGKHTVFVSDEGGPATSTTTTTTTVAPTTTAAPTTTVAVTTTSATLAPTTVPTTARPTTTPPVTIPTPVIGTITVTPGDCSLTVSVASFANTTFATVSLAGTPSDAPSDTPKELDAAAAPSSATIALGANSAATYQVSVTVSAGGPGGTSRSTVRVTLSASKC